MKPYQRPTEAVISLSALRKNLSILQSRLGGRSKILAIVKANGYGHGADIIAREAMARGAAGVGVADLSEALLLREKKITAPILCMGAMYPAGLPEAVKKNVVVTLHSAEQLKSFLRFARGKSGLRVHLKVETGMHRLGLDKETWGWVAGKLKREKKLRVEGIFTHLAESEAADDRFTRLQLQEFQSAVDFFESQLGRRLVRHAANSSAILKYPHSHFDWVRPGISMYGYPHPAAVTPKTDSGFAPVMTLQAPVLQVKELSAGDTVGYNRTFKAQRPMKIGVVAAGYADGFLRRWRAIGVGFRKKRIPVLGIICMDLFMVDLTEFKNARAGEKVTLFGDPKSGAPSAYDLAQATDTIPYEILTGVAFRVTRRPQ